LISSPICSDNAPPFSRHATGSGAVTLRHRGPFLRGPLLCGADGVGAGGKGAAALPAAVACATAVDATVEHHGPLGI